MTKRAGRRSDGDRQAVGRGGDLQGARPERAGRQRRLVRAGPGRPQGRSELHPGGRTREPAHVRQARAPARRHPRPARGRGRHDHRRPLAASGDPAARGEQRPAVQGRRAAAGEPADRHAERVRRRKQGGPDRPAHLDGADRPEHGPEPRLHVPAAAGRASVRRARQVPGRDQLRLDQPRPGHTQLHDRRNAVDARDRQHPARRRERPPEHPEHAPARRRLQPQSTAAATRCSR